MTRLRTGTVAVNARYRNGRLELGSIDKLLGEGTGTAELPDIVAQLKAVRIRLATDSGTVDLALDGTGNLRSGFAGRLICCVSGADVGRLHAERTQCEDHRRDRRGGRSG